MIYVVRIKIKKIEIILAVGDLLVLIFVYVSCKRREIKGDLSLNRVMIVILMFA